MTVYRVSCSSALCPKPLNIAHVTPWVQFRRNQSGNLRNTVSEVQKTPFFDGLSGFLQVGVVFETSNIAHVTPWVHFCRNQSVNLRNTVSEVQKTPFFDGLSGFLQLGGVLETSNIAHVTPWVHIFLGKNRLRTYFYLDGHTYNHTYIQSQTNTDIVIDEIEFHS